MYHPLVAFAAAIIGVTLLMVTLWVGASLNRHEYLSPGYYFCNCLVALVLLVEIGLGVFVINAIW